MEPPPKELLANLTEEDVVEWISLLPAPLASHAETFSHAGVRGGLLATLTLVRRLCCSATASTRCARQPGAPHCRLPLLLPRHPAAASLAPRTAEPADTAPCTR